MTDFDAEMRRALEEDGEKLRRLTGQEHGPVFLPEPPPCEQNYAGHIHDHPRFPSGDCLACGALCTEGDTHDVKDVLPALTAPHRPKEEP